MKRGRKLGKVSLAILKAVYELGKVALTEPPDIEVLRDYQKYSHGHFRGYFLKMYNLERRGYVKRKVNASNQSFFHLTPKGKLSILKYLQLERIKSTKWDKHWRVIIFDVPESIKKWREYLRRDLKNLGFHPLQESVYITPYPVTGELDQLLKEWNLRKYFRYLTVSEIDKAEELKEIFDLI